MGYPSVYHQDTDVGIVAWYRVGRERREAISTFEPRLSGSGGSSGNKEGSVMAMGLHIRVAGLFWQEGWLAMLRDYQGRIRVAMDGRVRLVARRHRDLLIAPWESSSQLPRYTLQPTSTEGTKHRDQPGLPSITNETRNEAGRLTSQALEARCLFIEARQVRSARFLSSTKRTAKLGGFGLLLLTS